MSRKVLWFSVEDTPNSGANQLDSKPQIEYFSIAQDLKMEKRPLKERYRLMIQDYSRYVQSRKASLKSDEINILDQMLINRFTSLINQVDEEIKTGKYLSNLLQITDGNLRKACDKFSREYKKMALQREALGYIPRRNQELVDDSYKLMIAELRKKVFAPVMNLFSHDPSDLPENLPIDPSQAKVLESKMVTPLAELYDRIVGFLRNENLDAKVDLTDENIKISL